MSNFCFSCACAELVPLRWANWSSTSVTSFWESSRRSISHRASKPGLRWFKFLGRQLRWFLGDSLMKFIKWTIPAVSIHVTIVSTIINLRLRRNALPFLYSSSSCLAESFWIRNFGFKFFQKEKIYQSSRTYLKSALGKDPCGFSAQAPGLVKAFWASCMKEKSELAKPGRKARNNFEAWVFFIKFSSFSS